MKITLQNISKTFGTTLAVDDFSCELPDGHLICLLGPSGCGKSTLLNMICGILTPSKGNIFFDEQDVTNLPPDKRNIGMVFQNYALYPHLTVLENIAFPLEIKKVPKKERVQKAIEIAKLVKVDNLLKRFPAELSGGQQQRVAIARALIKNPKILLMDEPLSNLDARLRLEMREEIRRIQKQTGITTVFVTHDQEEAMSISDQIVVMKFGILQQIDSPQEVYNNPANLFVAQFLGTPPINVFKGRLDGKKVLVGEDVVLETTEDMGQKNVYVAIRPEGFAKPTGAKGEHVIHAEAEMVQVLGRDISIVAKKPECLKETFKIIISSDDVTTDKNVTFAIKPAKCFVFDGETEERIHLK